MKEDPSENFLMKMNLRHVFQPIYNLKTWEIYGFEILLRSRAFPNIEDLFRNSREKNQLNNLDMYSIKTALQNSSHLHSTQALLFINIFPSTIIQSSFLSYFESVLKERKLLRKKIVFEINESKEEEYILESETFENTIKCLKDFGVSIALDDVGKEAASLKRIIELKPEMVKLDKYFSCNLSKSKEKQRLISFFVDYCYKNYKFILEGLETEDDLAMSKYLGVEYGQGYILQRPSELSINDNKYV